MCKCSSGSGFRCEASLSDVSAWCTADHLVEKLGIDTEGSDLTTGREYARHVSGSLNSLEASDSNKSPYQQSRGGSQRPCCHTMPEAEAVESGMQHDKGVQPGFEFYVTPEVPSADYIHQVLGPKPKALSSKPLRVLRLNIGPDRSPAKTGEFQQLRGQCARAELLGREEPVAVEVQSAVASGRARFRDSRPQAFERLEREKIRSGRPTEELTKLVQVLGLGRARG